MMKLAIKALSARPKPREGRDFKTLSPCDVTSIYDEDCDAKDAGATRVSYILLDYLRPQAGPSSSGISLRTLRILCGKAFDRKDRKEHPKVAKKC
jgi:hypothetical protein